MCKKCIILIRKFISTKEGHLVLNILICDDCSKTLEIIKNVVIEFYQEIKLKNFNIVTFSNPDDTISYVKDRYDEKFIYILDIELNGDKNGLLLAREIRKLDNYSNEIIFVTNHTELSFKVFQYKLCALEFIDKTYNLSKQLKETLLIATKILTKDKTEQNKLQIKVSSEIFNILIDNIVYVQTIKKTRKLVLFTKNSRIEFYSTLKDLKNSLDNNFIQIHKTTIINKKFIKCINNDPKYPYIELKTNVQCPLSRNGLKEVKKHWM